MNTVVTWVIRTGGASIFCAWILCIVDVLDRKETAKVFIMFVALGVGFVVIAWAYLLVRSMTRRLRGNAH